MRKFTGITVATIIVILLTGSWLFFFITKPAPRSVVTDLSIVAVSSNDKFLVTETWIIDSPNSGARIIRSFPQDTPIADISLKAVSGSPQMVPFQEQPWSPGSWTYRDRDNPATVSWWAPVEGSYTVEISYTTGPRPDGTFAFALAQDSTYFRVDFLQASFETLNPTTQQHGSIFDDGSLPLLFDLNSTFSIAKTAPSNLVVASTFVLVPETADATILHSTQVAASDSVNKYTWKTTTISLWWGFWLASFVVLFAILLVTYFSKGLDKIGKMPFDVTSPPTQDPPARISVLISQWRHMEWKDAFLSTLFDLVERGALIETVSQIKGVDPSIDVKFELPEYTPQYLLPFEKNVYDIASIALEEGPATTLELSSRLRARWAEVEVQLGRFSANLAADVQMQDIFRVDTNWAPRVFYTEILMFFSLLIALTGFLFIGIPMITVYRLFLIAGLVPLVSLWAVFGFWLARGLWGKYTPKGSYMARQWRSYKIFIEGSKQLPEATAPASKLWGEVFVYATALGVTDRYLSQLSDIDKTAASQLGMVTDALGSLLSAVGSTLDMGPTVTDQLFSATSETLAIAPSNKYSMTAKDNTSYLDK